MAKGKNTPKKGTKKGAAPKKGGKGSATPGTCSK